MTDELNENMLNAEESNPEDTSVNYINAINKLKATTVSKESYDKLMDENRNLIESLTNGTYETQKEDKPIVDATEIKRRQDDLFNHENNNLEFWKKALALREAQLQYSHTDIFAPSASESFTPSEESTRTAQKVANIVQECIDYADGDSELFTQELQRRTVDTPAIRRK